MSRLVDSDDVSEFKLGDRISFIHKGSRLIGKVVRVYNAGLLYHVEVDGQRYEVEVPDDKPQRIGEQFIRFTE